MKTVRHDSQMGEPTPLLREGERAYRMRWGQRTLHQPRYTMARRYGFTLIEMLVVIVIIGIMLALTLPSVTNLMKSGGLNGAARQVANTLNLARQYAITHRIKTRVVFPYSGTPGAGSASPAPMYQSYAVYAVGPPAAYVSKWEHLPLGTIFMDANHVSVGSPPSVDTLGPPAPFSFPYTNSPPTTMLAFIEFGPTGAASNPGAFTITEGFMNGNAPTPTSKNTITSTLANVVTVSVDNVIGRIQVTRP